MRRWWSALSMAALLMATQAQAQRAAPRGEEQPITVIGDRFIPIGSHAVFPLFASRGLDERRPEIDLAVIVIHGLFRDADVYYAGMVAAVRNAEEGGGTVKSARTLVIAPQFLSDRDAEHYRLRSGTAFWTANGWKGGEPALAPESHPSSFAALDALLEALADRERFPALRRIVVAGHSAGGQVVHRYAVVGRGDAAARRAGVEVRYIVANPSSYLYITSERPTDDGRGFAPYDRARCQRFDDYRYGMKSAPDYVTQRPVEAMLRDYAGRHVVYLLGTADTDPNHRVLDRSCAAAAQGPHRLARGEAYHRYVLGILGADAAGNHRKVLVEGVGHDHAAMFQSAAGRAALFALWP